MTIVGEGNKMAAAINWRRFVAVIVPLLLLLWSFVGVFQSVSAADLGCNTVRQRYAYGDRGLSSVPPMPVSGEQLQVCQQGRSCCTEDMEKDFVARSRSEFNRILNLTITGLHGTFAARTSKFDDFFRELLKKSKVDFHEMFLKTYGMLYEQNSEVFTDLFKELERYYSTGHVNLMDALDTFFITLYQKMFTVLNAQYTFDQKYLACVSEYMEELQPFGDVPRKLSLQIKRAFVAARVFVRGLMIGRDVVKNMLDVPFSPECNKALTKMSYCPHCQGLIDVKPCNNYCLNVLKGCLAYHAELNREWNSYIDALLMLADRLEGPFNIESVVDPIDIKISDAIMNFQESGPQVSQKVFQGCGQPRLGKRDVSHELIFDTLKFTKQSNTPRPTTAAGTSLDRLVRDIRGKIKGTRDFWTHLPKDICENDQVAATPPTDDDCWNGLAKAKYESQIMGDGVVNQAQNPEVDFDIHRQNSITNEQILSLKTATDRLKNAHNGMDVTWDDTADYVGSGASSGSGEGPSGAGEVVQEEEEDDDHDEEEEEEVVVEEEEDEVEEDDVIVENTKSNVDTDNDEVMVRGFTPVTTTITTTTTKTTTTMSPEVRSTNPTVSSAPLPTVTKMSLNQALSVISVPILVAWLGSMF